jgi:predicted dehydrogenase
MDNTTRRTFIQSGAALAVGAGLAGAPAFGQSVNANGRIRVAVVGLRGRGWDLMQAFHQLAGENVELAAVCEIDEAVLSDRIKDFESLSGKRPKTYIDVRKLLEDKSIDAVAHSTPTHWHSLGGIWTCQAGKDAYIEKPISHNIWEGRKLVEAARKYNRIVQHGTQCRSSPVVLEAMQKMRDGLIGNLFMARGVCFKYRGTVGRVKLADVPPGVHYDFWLGPAPWKPFSPQRFHYNWHWHWDYGAGDIGNMGVHQLDLIRMGLNLDTHPSMMQAMGGRYVFDDDRETPNVHSVFYHYPGRNLQVEMAVRGVYTNFEAGMGTELPFRLGAKSDIAGVIFYGSEGYLAIPDYSSYYTFLGLNRTPGPKRVDTEDLMQNLPHLRNFLKAMRSRKPTDLNADVEEGHKSAALSHLGNIAYRVGRGIEFDPKTERLKDEEANAYLSRKYREPYVVPEVV